MLNSQLWYTFNIESSYKKTSFIKIAIFFLIISGNLSDLQSKGRQQNYYYTTHIIRYFIYKTVRHEI